MTHRLSKLSHFFHIIRSRNMAAFSCVGCLGGGDGPNSFFLLPKRRKNAKVSDPPGPRPLSCPPQSLQLKLPRARSVELVPSRWLANNNMAPRPAPSKFSSHNDIHLNWSLGLSLHDGAHASCAASTPFYLQGSGDDEPASGSVLPHSPLSRWASGVWLRRLA